MEIKDILISVILLLIIASLGFVVYNQYFNAAVKTKIAQTAEKVAGTVGNIIEPMISSEEKKTSKSIPEGLGDMFSDIVSKTK